MSDSNNTIVTSIIGKVGSGGNRIRGKGFTSQKISEGLAQVNFDRAFSTAPTVVVTPETTAFGSKYVACLSIQNVGTSSFQVAMSHTNGEQVNLNFDFACFIDGGD